MGSALGCCGKSEEDVNNLTTAGFNRETFGADKIKRIVRI